VRSGTGTARIRKMRRISGSFWTPKRDEQLLQLEGYGFTAAKIAEALGTTRGAVLGRSHRLSGASLAFPSYIRQEKEARARSAARRKKRERVQSTVIPKMQQEIARGVERDRTIVRARKAGATLQAIADALGLTRERVRQIVEAQSSSARPSR
jgi:hypothetical protein